MFMPIRSTSSLAMLPPMHYDIPRFFKRIERCLRPFHVAQKVLKHGPICDDNGGKVPEVTVIYFACTPCAVPTKLGVFFHTALACFLYFFGYFRPPVESKFLRHRLDHHSADSILECVDSSIYDGHSLCLSQQLTIRSEEHTS